jgi:hypothetical protein
MAKATKTTRQALHYPPQYAAYFAANQALFNRVVAFYFDSIQAHEGRLALTNKQALTALEQLTHATHRSRGRYPCDVPTRCYQCRARLGSLLLLLSQTMANTEGETRSQTHEEGQEEAVEGAATSSPPLME